MSRTPSLFRQSDVIKALNAARRCHFDVVRTEISRDGSIVLHHQGDIHAPVVVDELEVWRAKRYARSA
jgi:hypothetical protein